jgi:diacylglycerol kinase (ATP)
MSSGCVVIVNPAAGGGRAARQWAALAPRLMAAGCPHQTLLTRRPGDATGLCRTALGAGANLVVAAGGDGTLNEVVNGFFDQATDAPIRPDAALGLLPLGTGSDFAAARGIGRGLAAIPVLAARTTQLFDVGRVDYQILSGSGSRYFINVAELGLGAEIAARVNRSPKRFGAFLAYLVGAIRSVLVYRGWTVTLQIDDAQPTTEPVGMVIIANSQRFGGGIPIMPGAQPDDGRFDVLRLGRTDRATLLFDLLPKVYRGKHIGHPAVSVDQATRLTVSASRPLPLEVDGEHVGIAPARLSILPRALPVVVPRNSA